jgi:hypothetical protein
VKLAVGFFELRLAAQPDASSSLGFFWRHAFPDIFVREHVEMGIKFLLEFLINVTG